MLQGVGLGFCCVGLRVVLFGVCLLFFGVCCVCCLQCRGCLFCFVLVSNVLACGVCLNWCVVFLFPWLVCEVVWLGCCVVIFGLACGCLCFVVSRAVV